MPRAQARGRKRRTGWLEQASNCLVTAAGEGARGHSGGEADSCRNPDASWSALQCPLVRQELTAILRRLARLAHYGLTIQPSRWRAGWPKASRQPRVQNLAEDWEWFRGLAVFGIGRRERLDHGIAYTTMEGVGVIEIIHLHITRPYLY